ncbi:MAG: adenosylcobinamide-GDP ribazoletransferase [Burkholderiales bacterium]|nr:adenosylcobinamide-GDP ribazoletransferase [Burkholderiales bacterium]
MNAVRRYLLALQFFTRIPVTGALARWVGFSPRMLRASAAHFPGVGLLVGGLCAAVYGALALALPDTAFTMLVAAALSTAFGVWITGAFHEDGLADVADGLGGSGSRDRALEIMKDSRVGAFGAIAAALALLCKVALLALLGAVDWRVAMAALVSAHVASRTLPLLLIRLLPHVGDAAGSKSKPLADRIGGVALAVGGLWCAAGLGLAGIELLPLELLGGVALATLAWLWMWRLFARRLAGFTGDCLGATQQVCEIAFYLGLALAMPVGAGA